MNLFGTEIFAGLLAWQVYLLGAVYAAAFFVKGIFGYGAVPILILAGSMLVEPHHAVVLAAVSNLATHVQYLPDGLRNGQRALVARAALFLLPAIAFGVWVFARLEGTSLSILAGGIILFSVLADARGWLKPLEPWVRAHPRFSAPVFGTTAGLISGIIGAGAIAFISLYVRIFERERQGFRGTIILVTAVILIWRTSMLTLAGEITWSVAGEAMLLLPGGLLAGWLGTRVSRRLADATFFRAYRAVLCLGAAIMIFRGLMTAA
ncbi:TSUP family transporter [Oricola sp.]|uniref:TSUP family transporter n=1 Tax=Oricola sp. TaxID=1979950 RepID=UPI0025CF98B5|nr:TSUP family transporter [Oricola sp.]MCI5074508.1 TSUP family transporter [Oricola sp.]